jgi:PAS domain
MLEHRMNERLMGYWTSLRKEEPMPDFALFNASSIADIWQNCILFTVSPADQGGKSHTLNFYQMGEKIRTMYGGDMVGRSFNSTQRHFQGAAIVKRVDEIISHPAAITDTGQFVNEKSKIIKYRSCLLPFGRHGTVTNLLIGLSWREF